MLSSVPGTADWLPLAVSSVMVISSDAAVGAGSVAAVCAGSAAPAMLSVEYPDPVPEVSTARAAVGSEKSNAAATKRWV